MATSNTSSQPLRISIVGAGIGGLTAAIALRKNGHLVQIFEAVEIKTEIGAALGVNINALKVLDHIGVSRDNLKGVPWHGNIFFGSEGGEGTTHRWLVPAANEHPGLLVHRSDVYEELKRLATSEGEGPPAELRLGVKVVACDPEEGTITLNGSETIRSDLILGADGVHSVIRTHIAGSVVNAQDSGLSCFRTVLEASNLRDIPELEWLHGGISGVRSIVLKGGPPKMLLVYPCRNGTLVNVVAFYPDSPEDAAGKSLFRGITQLHSHSRVPTATREELLAKFSDFDPKYLCLFDLPAHSEIHKWKLRMLPLLPTWVSGCAALLGDAAHAMLPLLGQGAAMAIEEAGSLGYLLPAGTKREDIPARLQAYQDLRKPRGDFVKTKSFEQIAQGFTFLRSKEMQSYLLEYEPINAAEECYQKLFGEESLAN
ncbi:FAD/NAD(P)-binding domain-containing protein [Mycena maculata]|uniref:FAD/NAD(P)-binding domain-containing protein n=1 Tax=Mycena maculata TaxID=230809 RepID=A0AAD7NEV8_9AGAR|nr:FAD/NAD(P)-binding domain-containing protein [Mycena maculata]